MDTHMSNSYVFYNTTKTKRLLLYLTSDTGPSSAFLSSQSCLIVQATPIIEFPDVHLSTFDSRTPPLSMRIHLGYPISCQMIPDWHILGNQFQTFHKHLLAPSILF